jgi:glycosyl transferase family 11
MVVVTLIGGLGNQMFQYAAGRALALRTQTRLVLDLGLLERPPPHLTPRRYELDCFRVEAELRTIYPRTALERLRELLRLSPQVWREEMFRFDPRTLELSGRVRLLGYWICERYFADYAAQIRQDFRFLAPLDDTNRELADRIRATTSVSVHVRRADYATDDATRAFHGVLPLDYYRTAAARIGEAVHDRQFFVFSDDSDWCRANLELGGPTTYVDHNTGRGCEDLRLMSLCRHHVIANSSFGWWGAWLNPREEKIVIAPRRWVADPSVATTDVVPAEWIRI